MSTRYVWKRFLNSTLKQNLSWGSELTGGGSGIGFDAESTLTLCSSYSITIDSSGHIKYKPSGSMYIYPFSGTVFMSSSTYSYCIISLPQGNDMILRPGSRTNYWVVGPSWIANAGGYMVSTSKVSGTQDSTAPVSTYYSGSLWLESITSTYISTGTPNAYTSDDTYSYLYLGSDSIDPASISYATVLEYQGEGNATKLPYTITESTSNKYGGTIEYNVEYKINNGSWNASTNWSTSTSGNRTNFEAGATYQFRVRARDGWGFTSTTYVTGPVCTVTQKLALVVFTSPNNGGTVSGAGEYTSGTKVTVKATPANGWEFVGWTENSVTVSTSASYTFTITASRTLTAVFKQKLRLWFGVDGKARKGVDMWVGVNGKARKVVGAWIGVNGKARRFL